MAFRSTTLFVSMLAFAAGSCAVEHDALEREVVDCSTDDTVCEDIPNAGCALDLLAVDAEGSVVGTCGEVPERRACTTHCEVAEDCPEGWQCRTADRCPGETRALYCVPSGSELQLQGIDSCRADADPRVCGFF